MVRRCFTSSLLYKLIGDMPLQVELVETNETNVDILQRFHECPDVSVYLTPGLSLTSDPGLHTRPPEISGKVGIISAERIPFVHHKQTKVDLDTRFLSFSSSFRSAPSSSSGR
eukprot:766328-Hanusia_phi.AAC.16